MTPSLRFPRSFHVVTLIAALVGVACGRTVSVDLTLAEACDQKTQALNGVNSYALKSEGGATATDPVTFNVAKGALAMPISLGDVVITAEAFTTDVSASGAGSTVPQAVGHTMPLKIQENTSDIAAMVLMGKVNTFGKTSDAQSACTTMTKGAPVRGRHGHTATFVPKLNKVLIVGGAVWVNGDAGPEERLLETVELWDPATGLFEKLEDINKRAYHAATAMPDGRVLISGGFGQIQGVLTTLVTGLVFDPDTKTLTSVNLRQPRAHHTSTYMPGLGLIVIAGGCVGAGPASGCTTTSAGAGADGPSTDLPVTMEIFDVEKTGSTTAVANGLVNGRAFHQASVIGSGPGEVLVVTGGANAGGPACDLEFFRMEAGTFSRVDAPNAAGFQPGKCPVRHAATSLDRERLLVVGGQTAAPGGTPSGPGSGDVFFVSAQGVGPVAVTTLLPRYGHLIAATTDGGVLVVGGVLPTDATSPVAERIAPQAGTNLLVSTPIAGLTGSRDHAAMALLPTNQVFYSGGHTTTTPMTTSPSAEVFFGR